MAGWILRILIQLVPSESTFACNVHQAFNSARNVTQELFLAPL